MQIEQKNKKIILGFYVLVIIILFFILGIFIYKKILKKEEIDVEKTMTYLCSHNSESFNKLLKKIDKLSESEIPDSLSKLKVLTDSKKDLVNNLIFKLNNKIKDVDIEFNEKKRRFQTLDFDYNEQSCKYNIMKDKETGNKKSEDLKNFERKLEKSKEELDLSRRLYEEKNKKLCELQTFEKKLKDELKEPNSLDKYKSINLEELEEFKTFENFKNYIIINPYFELSYLKSKTKSLYLKSFYKDIDNINLKNEEILKQYVEIINKLEQIKTLLIFRILRKNYLEFNRLLFNNNDLSNKSVFIEIPYYLRLAIEALNDFDKNDFCIYRKVNNKKVTTEDKAKSKKNKKYLEKFFINTENLKINYFLKIDNKVEYFKNTIDSYYDVDFNETPKNMIITNRITNKKFIFDYNSPNNHLTCLLILGSNDYQENKEKLNDLLELIGREGILTRNEWRPRNKN
ncbi:hypothetical protein RS022_05590 [Candidatus Phytoplasma rubi]|uniref:Effector n=1 Tax=Candidatus Phytoplasma rubi TaxID=399025 RepID=A0ABY7BSR6_9MOLU|nr:hypothetical protein [Candidatus Phytoplasma rubi]WAN63423.1 hypothetical protein RS022_05590 [Candidatus Phytoplasma rubi]